MSLINQVLKDLETRSTQSAQPGLNLSGLQATAVKVSGSKKRYLLILGLLSLVFVWVWNLTYYYHAYHKSTPKLETKELATAVKATSPAKISEVLNPVPLKTTKPVTETAGQVALTGITMQVHGKMTYLRFLLNRDVVYQVSSDPLQSSLVISLKNTNLTVNVPPLDYINSALADLKISHEVNDELKLTLMLKPDAKLSNLELNKESKYPELQADFLTETAPLVSKALDSENESKLESPTGTLKKVAVDLPADEQYQEALNLMEAGEVDKASHLLALLVYKYPEYNQARESLINVLIKQGKEQKAEELLADGLELQPYYPAFVEFKAHLLVDAGRIKEALNLLKKAPPALATNPEYYAFIAALYQRMGQLPSAENLYQQLTALHPEKGVWWLGLGVTEEGLGKNAQALEAYARADRSQDLDPELRGYVGSRLRG